MADISNRTLGTLFAVFVVVAGFGLYISGGGITGMASQENVSGNVSATVVADVNINATDALISFGDVTNDDFNRSEDSSVADNITIESIGTTIVQIDYWANHSLFTRMNGTTPVTNDRAMTDFSYMIRILNNGTCGIVNISSYTNVSVGFGNITDLIQDCDQNDEFTVGIQIYVPRYEPAGAKNSQLNFRATEYTG